MTNISWRIRWFFKKIWNSVFERRRTIRNLARINHAIAPLTTTLEQFEAEDDTFAWPHDMAAQNE